ncbi:MAG: hypothetical protein KGL44_09045 [Sphingomonadales bacterium]|nr:hypothetical protein [Sphingomonadales bacterium]
MREIELPQLRATGVVAVTLEAAVIAGSPVWIATTRERINSAARRRWFPDEALALAHAAQEADRFGLALLDLREGADQ